MPASLAVTAAAAVLLLASSPSSASPLSAARPIQDVATLDSPAQPSWNCSIQAWVRAPDLRPNVVVPADARLVANGTDCSDVRQWDVGLRLKERGYVKLRAAEVVLPEAPKYKETAQEAFWELRQQSRSNNGLFEVDSWLLDDRRDRLQSPFDIARKTYMQAMQNRSLWEGFASERVAFDSRITLDQLEGANSSFPLRSIKSFQVAVPNVNFPPAKKRSYMHYYDDEVKEEAGIEQAFEFYAAVTLKNGSVLDFPASKALFVPEQPVELTAEEVVFQTVLKAPPYERWNRWERSAKTTFDNSTTFELTIKLPNPERIFEAGSTTMLPMTIKRLNGTQQPTSIAAYASSRQSYTWAASFAHTSEQADSLSKLQTHERSGWDNPFLTKEPSVALNTTLEGEALERLEERNEQRMGRFREHWFDRSVRPNKTELDPLLEEQTVLVNLTLPDRLFPTINTTFTSILSSLHFHLGTSAPRNETDLASQAYPLLSDLDDDEAWRSLPYEHIEKLVSHLDSQSGNAASGRLAFTGNTSITVVPANSTTTSPPSSPLPLSYLSPSALAPVLLPLTSGPLEDLSTVPFPFLNQTLRAEGIAADGSDLVKKRYSDERDGWRGDRDGRNEWAGRLWERKVAREKEYREREEKLQAEAEAAEGEKTRLVVQA
ncbi:hypothetical protein JCM6882_001638 [Rhodosporidiobolus microsporus]